MAEIWSITVIVGPIILIAAIIYCFAWMFGVIGVWVSLATCSTILTIWMFYAMKRVEARLQ